MIFGKGNNRTASEIAAASIETSQFPTLIGSDMVITGHISGGGELQIDGNVQGDINAEHVVVAQQAFVTGNIKAQTVFISGRVNGNIEAKSIEATKSAQIKGDLTHSEISIEAGAVVDGLCKPASPSAEMKSVDMKSKALGDAKKAS